MTTKADRYEGLDGLKAYAILGIARLSKWKFWLNRIYIPKANTVFYEPCVSFYDGQWIWYVLWLLPENY